MVFPAKLLFHSEDLEICQAFRDCNITGIHAVVLHFPLERTFSTRMAVVAVR